MTKFLSGSGRFLFGHLAAISNIDNLLLLEKLCSPSGKAFERSDKIISEIALALMYFNTLYQTQTDHDGDHMTAAVTHQ